MCQSRFSESQVMTMLKLNESTAMFYTWHAKFSGMDASMIKSLKELKDENRCLKKMYAEERLKAEIRQEALERKL